MNLVSRDGKSDGTKHEVDIDYATTIVTSEVSSTSACYHWSVDYAGTNLEINESTLFAVRKRGKTLNEKK